MTSFLLIVSLPLIALILLYPSRKAVRDIDTLAAHKARLKAVEDDLARGAIDEGEADSARVEIKRRLLKAAKSSDAFKMPAGTGIRYKHFIAAVVLTTIPGIVLYSKIGSPNLGASEAVTSSVLDEKLRADVNITFREALTTIEAQLAENPANLKAWQILASTRLGVGDAAGAAQAYGALAEQAPSRSGKINAYVEQIRAMMAMADGAMTPAALLILEKIAGLNPTHPSIDFLRGVGAAQAGKTGAARGIWQGLIDRSDPSAAYIADIKRELARLDEILAASQAAPQAAPLPAIDRETLESVAEMTPEEQRDFIRSMVMRLENRLAENPNDIEGWQRLTVALKRFGEKDRAQALLTDALNKVEPQNRAVLQQLLDNLAESPNL